MNRFRQRILLILLFHPIWMYSQSLMPGFDKEEYTQMMYISAKTSALDSVYYNKFPNPGNFQNHYRSASIGLDNLWELWVDESNKQAAISIRGTTENAESWLANFYAAMVPAKGALTLAENDVFTYHLADDPKAAVHVGWLLSTAFLSKEIIPQINALYDRGIKNVLIVGHSQGGAISYLLTAYLYGLQREHQLPSDIRFKTYCSAAPKPGNLYFAYEYEAMTQGGWAYNVVNASDWVPEMPISIQTLRDFNYSNPFTNAKWMIKKQKFPANLVLKHVYNQLDKPTKKAQKKYEKYLGDMAAQIIKQFIPEFEPPVLYSSNHYVRTGATIVLLPDDNYFQVYPDDSSKLFPHHFHDPYLFLLKQLPESKSKPTVGELAYSPSPPLIAHSKQNLKTTSTKRAFVHSLLGIEWAQTTSLNQMLETNGFLPSENTVFTRGAGFYTLFPKIHLATLFQFSTFSTNQVSGNQSNALRGTTAGTSLGVPIIQSDRWQCVPYIGAVYSWFGVRVSNNQTTATSFNQYLTSNANQHHIATEGFIGNAGVHGSWAPFSGSNFWKSWNFGLRAGYYFPFTRSMKWNTNGYTLPDGPSGNPHGPYACFIIGISI